MLMKISTEGLATKESGEKGAFKMYSTRSRLSRYVVFLKCSTYSMRLIKKNEEPVAFDHDCREESCRMCSCLHQWLPQATAAKQRPASLHMRQGSYRNRITVMNVRI